MKIASAYIKILESDAEIVRRIKAALLVELNASINSAFVDKIKNVIGTEIKRVLIEAPEAQSILFGELRGQFGFHVGSEAVFVQKIVQTIADNIEVKYNKLQINSNGISGGFVFYVARAKFDDILALPEAKIHYIDRFGQAQNLPWLEWLLHRGNNLIISEHSLLLLGHYPSRSKTYIMIKDLDGFWKVPSEFAGTARDNWITRALDNSQKKITEIIRAALEREFA